MTFDELRSLTAISLNDALDNTFEVYYKSICRWYSREFHTPLRDVEGFSEEYVLQTFYDDLYYRLTHSDSEEDKTRLQDIKNTILADDIVTQQRDQDDAEWIKELEEEMAVTRAKLAEKQKKDDLNKQDPNLIDEEIHFSGGEENF